MNAVAKNSIPKRVDGYLRVPRSMQAPTFLDGNFLASRCYSNSLSLWALRLPDRLDFSALQEAFVHLFQQYPTIGCDLFNGCWEEALLKPDNVISHSDLRGIDAESVLPKILTKIMLQDVNPAAAPHLRAALMTLDDSDLLVLRSAHTPVDGYTMRWLMARLAANYSTLVAGQPMPPAPVTLSAYDALSGIYLRSAYDSAVVAESLNLRTRFSTEMWAARQPLNFAESEGGQPGFVRLALSQESVQQLKLARVKSCTLNDQLLATLILAMRNTEGVKGGPEVKIAIPADMRRYVRGNQLVLGNLASVTSLRVQVSEGDGYTDVLNKVSKAQLKAKSIGIGLPEILCLPTIAAPDNFMLNQLERFNQDQLRRGLTGQVFSNSGSLDRSQFKFGDVVPTEILSLPAIPRCPGAINAGCYGYDGKLYVGFPVNDDRPSSPLHQLANNWRTMLFAAMSDPDRGEITIDDGVKLTVR